MDEIHLDVIGLQSTKRPFQCRLEFLRIEATRHHLGCDHRPIPPTRQRLADYLLGMTLAICLRRVDQGDPELQGTINNPEGLRIIRGTPKRP